MDRSQHVPLLRIKGQTDALLQLNIPLVILQIKMLFFNLTYANNEEVSFDCSRVHKASNIFYSNHHLYRNRFNFDYYSIAIDLILITTIIAI